MSKFATNVTVAPDQLLANAKRILASPMRCSLAVGWEIRVVAQAYIDEVEALIVTANSVRHRDQGDETKCPSPSGYIEIAKRLRKVQLTDKDLQQQVRTIARNYLAIDENKCGFFHAFLAEDLHDLAQNRRSVTLAGHRRWHCWLSAVQTPYSAITPDRKLGVPPQPNHHGRGHSRELDDRFIPS